MGMFYIVSDTRGDIPVSPGSVCYDEKDTKCCLSNFQSNKTEPKKLYTTGFNDKLYSILQKEMAGNERFPVLHRVPIIDHFGFFYSEAF